MSVPSSLREFEETLIAGIDPVAVPSVAYGIARGEEILLLGAAGLADKERGIAATPQTAYSMASVTKPMTTTAAMLLATRGLIDLDAPMDTYLGEAKLSGAAGDAREATVRRVADHTAGLPLHYQFYYEDEPDARPPFEESVRRYGKLFTPAGERHQYSNLGYGMLDDAVARVSGVPYKQFMAEAIFAPLGMAHAAIDAPTRGEVAVAYGPDGVGYPRYDFDHPGGSAAYASVEDLLAFGRFHLGHGPDLFPFESRQAMQAPTAPAYGFGWGVNADRLGLRFVAHTGGMGGVNTILRLVPELDLVIGILINGQGELPFRGADDAVAALHPEFRARLIADRAKPKPEPAKVPVPEALWGTWRGTLQTHRGTLPLTLEIRSGHEARAILNGHEASVDDLQMSNGRLGGALDGDVETEDAGRRPYRIHLDLAARGEVLNGAAVTLTKPVENPGGTPGRRMGNALAYWTELRR
ncbi:MAG: serine hydrolase domain-containing protein [Fimbriimonas sp.]